MKKLLFGLAIGLLTMAFSAFTTVNKARSLGEIYALLPDGNYHKLASYDPTLCRVNPSFQCAYQQVISGSIPDTMTPAVFSTFNSSGYFSPYGNKGKYTP